ncbi:hypothetical protein P3T73_16415 [Kiritimatiellota bacterium B12222]|nr:hypothetical protein P3T73_16415 [Kiritimatiellota bacterium B12222]
MTQTHDRKAGFSLKALFISLFFSFLLILFIVPVLTKALETGTTSRLLANGTGIYKSLFAEIADVQASLYSEATVALPQSSTHPTDPKLEFETSTDYFVFLVSNDIISVNWSYFAGHDIPAAIGKFDPEDLSSIANFKAENNAWVVVADLEVDDTGSPFLITKNLQGHSLEDHFGDEEAPIVTGPPYGKKQLAIIRIGGSGEYMTKRNILWKNINPNETDNLILRP